MQNKYHTNMNKDKKTLLKELLINGSINVQKYEEIKDDIFNACNLSKSESKDRVLWSRWINGKVVPNRFCQVAINSVLSEHKLQPIYD